MANYSSFESSAYQSSNGVGGGADVAFQQADSNQDGRVDLGEFRNFVGQNLGVSGGAGYGSSSSYEAASSSTGVGGGYDASFAGGAGYGAGAAGYGAGAAGFGAAGAGLAGGASSYESSSFSSNTGYGAGAGLAAAGGAAYESSSSSTQVQQYATDAQGLFQDANPQIIRRPAPGGVQTYTQNIRVRFLQPPPVPPPGPLIIKEVRPPQPPPPPPLRIRQQAPPLPQPPPLVLRERPPQPPASVASQTVVRRLAAIAVPPRSVVIERLPPLPPRPRDIIIERWVPYGAQAKRRTIVQRAGAAHQYTQPRNVIIQYEPVQVRIVRQFQRLGVTPSNPQAYVQQYGAQLLEAAVLVQQARSAGVVEDISPPAVAGGFSAGSSSFSQEASFGAAGLDAGAGFAAGAGVGLDAGFGAAGGASSYESSSFSSGAVGGLDAGFAAGGLAGGLGGGYGSSSFESSSYSSGVGGGEAAFAGADFNQSGALEQGELNNFAGQGLAGGVGGSSSYEASSFSSSGAY